MYNYRNHSLTAVRPSEDGINPGNQCFQPQIYRAQQSIYQLSHLISLQGTEALIITSATWHRADISNGNSHLAVQIMKAENQTQTNCIFLLSVASFKCNEGQRIRLTLNVSKSAQQKVWVPTQERGTTQKELSEPKCAAQGLVRGIRQSWLTNG